MSGFLFQFLHKDAQTNARSGIIHTPHGDIQTPAFVPVGTQATVKSLTPDELTELGVELFFVNTYHAYLRPGIEVINKFSGLHKFMNWSGPLITDSGGFQVFSLGTKKFVNIAISESAVMDLEKFTRKLSKSEAVKSQVFPDDYRPVSELVKIDEEGVTFTSHWDGSSHRFTPEFSMALQWDLGSDIHIAFDECAPYPTSHEYAKKAMERTHRWATRSLEFHKRQMSLRGAPPQAGRRGNPLIEDIFSTPQALYGVIQGSVYKDLRIESAKFISSLDTDGIAIGGVAVGESKTEMKNVLDWVIPFLPRQKPRHLLGVGEIDDIFELVATGVDTFDCVQPTRLARAGILLLNSSNLSNLSNWSNSSNKHQLDITKSAFSHDTAPIDPTCTCSTCTHFSRAYLHHLFRVRELLGYRLATIHNLHLMQTLMRKVRQAISENRFLELKSHWVI